MNDIKYIIKGILKILILPIIFMIYVIIRSYEFILEFGRK
jgi:hypothetical protein